VSIGRIFLIFAAAVGVVSGCVLVFVPKSRDIGIEPYFWVLIAILLFETVLFMRRGTSAAAPISMPTRIAGFLLAMALMFLIPLTAGVQVKYF
jgi:hypothetical protein